LERDRICFLHIGTHKTGTTSIQRLLALNESPLRQAGVYIPSAGRPYAFDGHHNIAWQLNGDSRFDPTCGSLDSVVREISERGTSAACLSSEDFEYLHAKPQRLYDVARAFAGIRYAVRIILYVRPRHEYERSLYQELSTHHGITETAAQFNEMISRDKLFRCREEWVFQFDYDRLLEPFARVFGADNMIVRNYRSAGLDSNLLDDFLEMRSYRNTQKPPLRNFNCHPGSIARYRFEENIYRTSSTVTGCAQRCRLRSDGVAVGTRCCALHL